MAYTNGDRFIVRVVAIFFLAVGISAVLTIMKIDRFTSSVAIVLLAGLPLVTVLKKELRIQGKPEILSLSGLIIPLGIILGLFLHFSGKSSSSS